MAFEGISILILRNITSSLCPDLSIIYRETSKILWLDLTFIFSYYFAERKTNATFHIIVLPRKPTSTPILYIHVATILYGLGSQTEPTRWHAQLFKILYPYYPYVRYIFTVWCADILSIVSFIHLTLGRKVQSYITSVLSKSCANIELHKYNNTCIQIHVCVISLFCRNIHA